MSACATETKIIITLDDYFPGTQHYIAIDYNTLFGSSGLIIEKIESSCKCLKPIQQQPSCSDDMNLLYLAPDVAGNYEYRLAVTYKKNEDSIYRKTAIILKSKIVDRISCSPEHLNLKLNCKNYRIELVANDNQSFRIKSVVANFPGLKFGYRDEISTAHKIVIQSDVKKLPSFYNHIVTISTDHQYLPIINIPCKIIPSYSPIPNRLVFTDTIRGIEKTAKVKILNESKLKASITSYASDTGFFSLNKSNLEDEYEIELLVPLSYGKSYFKDILILTTTTGDEINLPCLVWLEDTNISTESETTDSAILSLGAYAPVLNHYRKKGSILLSANKLWIPYLGQGKTVNFEEKITNTGTEEYDLKIHSSCSSCSKTKLSKQTLQPGESCYLRFSTSHSSPGPFSQTLWLIEKNKRFPPQKIVVSGVIEKEYDIDIHWQQSPEFDSPGQKDLSDAQKKGLAPIYLYVKVTGKNKYDTAATANSVTCISEYFNLIKYYFHPEAKGKFHAELLFELKEKIRKPKQYLDWIGMNFENILKLSQKIIFSAQ